MPYYNTYENKNKIQVYLDKFLKNCKEAIRVRTEFVNFSFSHESDLPVFITCIGSFWTRERIVSRPNLRIRYVTLLSICVDFKLFLMTKNIFKNKMWPHIGCLLHLHLFFSILIPGACAAQVEGSFGHNTT